MMILVALCILFAACPVFADPGTAVVGSRSVATHLTAFAEVQNIQTVTIRAPLAGSITDFLAVPGMLVHREEILARVSGPEYRMELKKARAKLTRARTALSLAKNTSEGVKKTYPDLSTRQQLADAEAAVSNAEAGLQEARARLRFLQKAAVIRASTAGTVLATLVGNGERVAVGDPLLRIAPRKGLWLRAVFYGPEASELYAGMTGIFRPSGGTTGIPVKVRSVIESLRPDGGRGVACVTISHHTKWYAGQMGTVDLSGPAREWAIVPSSALVLDRGRWWVLVHTPRGDHRQAVVPGPAEGTDTLIRKGLKPGQQVIVVNVYLRFHREFSRHYQPAD